MFDEWGIKSAISTTLLQSLVLVFGRGLFYIVDIKKLYNLTQEQKYLIKLCLENKDLILLNSRIDVDLLIDRRVIRAVQVKGGTRRSIRLPWVIAAWLKLKPSLLNGAEADSLLYTKEDIPMLEKELKILEKGAKDDDASALDIIDVMSEGNVKAYDKATAEGSQFIKQLSEKKYVNSQQMTRQDVDPFELDASTGAIFMYATRKEGIERIAILKDLIKP